MNNTTVVTASDMNYLWGVFMLIASMRRHGMDEPVLVLGTGYTPEARQLLAQFGNVKVADAAPTRRSMTCQKAEAMLLAETEYAAWADCDGFFSGNCSEYLYCEDADTIHVRKRSRPEMLAPFRGIYTPDDVAGSIPAAVLDAWRQDVGERDQARLDTCCSACFLSLHRKHRAFLERWRDQMISVLPDDDVGVVDKRSTAYFQTDESVLNSLLCFLRDAPQVAPSYKLDKDPAALYIHFVCHPKPWVGWTPYAFPHYDKYLDVIEFVLEQNFRLPGKLPFSLTPGNKLCCRMLMQPIQLYSRLQRVRKRWHAASAGKK